MGSAAPQSNPTRAARFCSLSARVSAGKPSGTSASTLWSSPASPGALGRLAVLPERLERRAAGDLGRRRTHADGARSSCPRCVRHRVEIEAALPPRPSACSRRPAAADRPARRERGPVLALDRVGDLVGFLDRVGGDGREGLLDVPGAAALGIAQPRITASSRSIPRSVSLTAGCPGRRPAPAPAGRTARSRPARPASSPSAKTMSSSLSPPSAARLGTICPAWRPRTMA